MTKQAKATTFTSSGSIVERLKRRVSSAIFVDPMGSVKLHERDFRR